MASFSQSPFFSSLLPINKNNTCAAFSPQPKYFVTFKNFKISSSISESSPDSQENSLEEDPVKLALAKAKAYKNSKQANTQEPYSELNDGAENKEVPLAVKLALEKAKEYKKSKSLAENDGPSSEIVRNSVMGSAKIDEEIEANDDDDDGGAKEVPSAVKIALEKAKEYKNNKGVVGSESLPSGLKRTNEKRAEDKQLNKSDGKREGLTVSSIDFMGLGFADKKSGRDLPAGLVPLSDPFPEGDFPEVEILVGDMSKFGDPLEVSEVISTNEEDDDELYKPKVSTWGVFPRPNDISKTYGGGRTIRPGDTLETAEERTAKQARTKKLLAAYKKKMGLNIDPKLKSECEKALKDGDSLMDLGNLKEALPFYEQVMEKMAFQSELHGLAALQWSICQDSLNRYNEARTMYEKLQSHPSPKVSKKARQFVFGFQAMEMLKVRSLNSTPRSTGYQNYFEAFVQNKTNYAAKQSEEDEDAMAQAFPYAIFLLSPIFMVLIIAVFRSR